jgi:archaellum component FlaF (FlaF/FlaG flagellin family)
MKRKEKILISATLLILVILILSIFSHYTRIKNAQSTSISTIDSKVNLALVKPSVKPAPAVTSTSPTPVQTPVAITKKSSTPKVQITHTAIAKPKVKLSPSPTSTSRYPRMRGDVVPMNDTNRPYTAGKDIPVGLYHSTNSICGYQIRRVDKSLFNVSTYEKGSTVVQINTGEQLLNSDCSVTFGPPTFQDILLPGSHLVGVDIEPGIYHAENNLSCMFALVSSAVLTRGNETIKFGFGNLNGVRDMLIPVDAEGVDFTSECGVLTKVG